MKASDSWRYSRLPAPRRATVTSSVGDTNLARTIRIQLPASGVTPEADLSITKHGRRDPCDAGGSVTYTISASNAGPSDAPIQQRRRDPFPAILNATWTCVGAGGGTSHGFRFGQHQQHSGTCPQAAALPSPTRCRPRSSSAATGTFANTRERSRRAAGITETNFGDNTATDTLRTRWWQSADLAITKTDGVLPAAPGGSVTYTITVASNAGPVQRDGRDGGKDDHISCFAHGVTWTCVAHVGGCGRARRRASATSTTR